VTSSYILTIREEEKKRSSRLVENDLVMLVKSQFVWEVNVGTCAYAFIVVNNASPN